MTEQLRWVVRWPPSTGQPEDNEGIILHELRFLDAAFPTEKAAFAFARQLEGTLFGELEIVEEVRVSAARVRDDDDLCAYKDKNGEWWAEHGTQHFFEGRVPE